eukprot:TRINITY_DN34500_c0_g1_i1.p1 TRINITY_DN34500_c0_g1~~TRINITY_DN34500_c0_g1_i1.p1  ORF type:complete len:573 (-),score=125.40 TRINITY_DN34500_c0_g1_i1:83-1801(-)
MEDLPEWVPEEDDAPSAADIAICAKVLRQMQVTDLEKPEFKEVRDAGIPVFKRSILKDRFGGGDVLDFLKEKTDVYNMKVKLERLHKVVKDEHEERKQKAETCGMNLRRKADLEAIKAESALPDVEDRPAMICNEVQMESVENQEDKSDNAKDAITGTSDATHSTASTGINLDDVEKMASVPRDSLYSGCNMCRGKYIERHHFYHQLCPRCAEHNWDKRMQTSDMSGMVCVVTGGRVRIGYQIVLKLLRAGAFVLATTRYPYDCAQRFAKEPDFGEWRERLEVCGPVELCDMRGVERFCDQLIKRFPRIHVLINNAAQTLTRREGWNSRMAELEHTAAEGLAPSARALLRPPTRLAEAVKDVESPTKADTMEIVPLPQANVMWHEANTEDFPEGQLDESRQPLDLSKANSWSRRLGSISTLELLQTLAANTAAPFIMCSRLAEVLAPKDESEPYGHIVNVSALEGKFSVRNKSSGHPHTNMAKAALNMLTHTSSKDMFQRRVLMNCVDTGWVTDMAPMGVGPVAASNATWVGPPLDEEDGAARVLDPVFSHLLDPTWLVRGKFFKNYYVCQW